MTRPNLLAPAVACLAPLLTAAACPAADVSFPSVRDLAATADAVVLAEPVGWDPRWDEPAPPTPFDPEPGDGPRRETDGPIRWRVTAVLRGTSTFPPPAGASAAPPDPPTVGDEIVVRPFDYWSVPRDIEGGFDWPGEPPADPPELVAAALFLYDANRVPPPDDFGWVAAFRTSEEDPAAVPAAGWVCPAAYFGTADGELLRASQRSNPGPVELSAAGPFAAFVGRVRDAVAGADPPDWRALPDDRDRAAALLEWAGKAVTEAEAEEAAAAEEAEANGFVRFLPGYGRPAGPVRAVREVLRSGPPDLAVRALLFRADAVVAGWREEPFFSLMPPWPFAGSAAREGTGSLLTDGEVTARGTPSRRGAGTFGTAAGRAAALAALADPARTPAEVLLLVDLLTDWRLLFARESDGFSEIPNPSEPLTAARSPEHLALIAGVGRALRHPDPVVRGFAADRLPNLLPPAARSVLSRFRGGRSNGPWRLSAFAALQRLHDDLPPGVTRNAFAVELCGPLGLWWADPTDRDAGARLICELTGSEAALLVTLPRTVTRASADAKTAEVRFDLHPKPGRGPKHVPPDERVTVRAAELTPPDGSAVLTVGVSGVTVEPSGEGWRATATLDLTDRLTRLNDPDGVAPGRWTVRLRGETVPDGGDDANDGGGLNWVSEPGVLAVE